MAKNKGWWDLNLTANKMDELSYEDRVHIAKLIIGGCTGGEIIEEEDFCDAEDIYPNYEDIEITRKY